MSKETLLIVGLGNPGEKYAHTRHNAGFEVLGRLAESFGAQFRRRLLLQGQTAEVSLGEKKLVLCEPLTFMNRSGECVRRLLARYRVPMENLLVVYDDIDLPPGRVRVRRSGGTGTHNGMRSIADCLGKTDFPRVRVGTGDRPGRTWRPGCSAGRKAKKRQRWKRPLTTRRKPRASGRGKA